MRKPIHIALAVLFVALVSVLVWHVLRLREPVYQGKALAVWLEQYANYRWSAGASFADAELVEQAKIALRQIGTNAVPVYFGMITAKDSPLILKLMANVPNGWRAWFQTRNFDRNRILGAYGFMALGADAKPYVPALIALLHHKNSDVGRAAFFALRSLGPVASDAVPSLIQCLDEPDLGLKLDAMGCLGAIHQEPERVVPILIQLVANYRAATILRLEALTSLSKFEAQAKAAVPTLVALLDDRNESIRSRAISALLRIDPEAAANAGVK